MPVTLTVLRCPPSVAPEERHVLGGQFSIGRGPENDWVLPDPAKHLSKRHCIIAYRNGVWQVAGTSTNGTFINRVEQPLEAREPHTLVDGDRLILGVYEIEVRVTEEFASGWGRPAPTDADRFSNPFDDDPYAPVPPMQAAADPAGPVSREAAFSPKLPAEFDPLLPDEDDSFRGSSRPDHSPAVSDAINLPHPKSVLPDNWNDPEEFAPRPLPAKPPERSEQIAPVRANRQIAPAPETEAASSAPPGELLAAFLRGAGLENLALSDPMQTMEQLGGAFRAMVSGIRQALIARSEVKREFRIEATMIRRRGNNVLKFSADDDDALTGLLGAGRRTDMGPEEAITDALTDIRLHELATMTAMQAAVKTLVIRLGPDQVRDPKDQGGGLALLGNRKARAWDTYEALHAQVLRGLSDDFDSVFGKRFAQAYEQAMHELLAKQRNQRDERR